MNLRKLLWLLPLLIVAIGAFVFLRKNPVKFLKRELDIIDLKAGIRKGLVDRTARTISANIEKHHKSTLDGLDEEKKVKAYKLRHDPARLAAYLTRLSD